MLTPADCRYDLADLAAARAGCALGAPTGSMRPVILEVPEASHLSSAQSAADRAYQLLLAETADSPWLQL